MPLFPVRRDAESAAFLDGTRNHQFLLVRDTATGDILDPKTDTGIDPERYERVPAKGAATVVSWAVVHGRTADGAPNRTVVGIVELDEGPWWWAEITDVDPDADLMGAGVEVAFVETGPSEKDETIPVFRAVVTA